MRDSGTVDCTKQEFVVRKKHRQVDLPQEHKSKRRCLDFMFGEMFAAELLYEQVLS